MEEFNDCLPVTLKLMNIIIVFLSDALSEKKNKEIMSVSKLKFES